MCIRSAIMRVRTNIILDNEMVEEAKRLTSLKTKKEVVDLALKELVKQMRQKKLLTLRRKGLWEGNLAGLREKRFDID